MFVLLLPLIKNLASRTRAWILVLGGCLIAAMGIGLSTVGVAVHTPQITRIGIIVLLIAAAGTPTMLRARRNVQNDGGSE